MIKKVAIKNFKCYRDLPSVDLAPITLLYGENSSGKSSFLQSLLLSSNAVDAFTFEYGDGPAYTKLKHGVLSSDAAELIDEKAGNTVIEINSAKGQSFAVELGIAPLSSDYLVRSFSPASWVTVENNLFIPLDDHGSPVAVEHKVSLKYSWGKHPLIHDIYLELSQRRQDVVDGYRRLSKLIGLSDYSKIPKINSAIKKILNTCLREEVDECGNAVSGHLCDSAVEPIPPEKRFLDKLDPWYDFAAPDWFVKQQNYPDSQFIANQIKFFSEDFTESQLIERLDAHPSVRVDSSRGCHISALKNFSSKNICDLPLLVLDCAMSSDPRLCLYGQDDHEYNFEFWYYMECVSDSWISKHLANSIGVQNERGGIRSAHNRILAAINKHVVTPEFTIEWLGPLRKSPMSRYKPLNKIGLDALVDKKSDPYEVSEAIINPRSRRQINRWLGKLGIDYELELEVVDYPAGGLELLPDKGASNSSKFDPNKHSSTRILLVDLRRKEELFVNFAEAGFGLSQVLPIIATAQNEKPSTIAIQQPELHIHPRLQAELGELFYEGYKNQGHQFIIETHSEHLMLRIQRLIRKGELKPEDVSVLYVSRGEDGSSVQRLRLDEEGEFLDPWPDGFFPERMVEIFG